MLRTAAFVAAFLCGGSAALALDASCFIWEDAVNLTSSIVSTDQVNGSNIVVTIASHDAGGINSVTWNGMEFVNDFLIGRQFASAVVWDGLHECNNPTDTGSADDTAHAATDNQSIHVGNLNSHSVLEYMRATGNQINTVVWGANWLIAPETTSDNCRGLGPATITDVPSKTRIVKTVTIGTPTAINAVKYTVTYTDATYSHTEGSYEALGLFMNAALINFWKFNPSTGVLTDFNGSVPPPDACSDPTGQNVPLIASTLAGDYAIGIMNVGDSRARYAACNITAAPRSSFDQVTKINCAFGQTGVPVGTSSTFTCYFVIGTLAQVQSGMMAVQNNP